MLRKHFSSETIEARRKSHNIFQVLKVKKDYPTVLHPVKTSSGMKGKSRHSKTNEAIINSCLNVGTRKKEKTFTFQFGRFNII